MKESSVEGALVRGCHRRGWLCLKLQGWQNLDLRGFPDRTIIGPDRMVDFAELKRPGEDPEPLQAWWHRTLRRLGFECPVIDDPAQVEPFLSRLEARRRGGGGV